MNKFYTMLVTYIPVYSEKNWEDMTDDDFIKLDEQAYHNLKTILKINDYQNISFRHFKSLDGFLDVAEN